MQVKYSNTKEDFFIFYFSQVFLKRITYNNWVFDFVDVFKVKKEKIRSVKLDNETKTKLLKGENLGIFLKYDFIYNFYTPISKDKMDFVIAILNQKLSKLYIFLEKLIGKSNLPKSINIAFVQSPVNKARTDLDAFTSKATKDKIFFNFDNNIDLRDTDKIHYYIRVLLHEFTHIFINHNECFQKVMKDEWVKNYKDIDVNKYRLNIEELMVGSIIFPAKDFGFSFKEIGLVEDEDKKRDSINKNKYRKMTFEFLENLKNSREKNKLEKYLPKLVGKLVKKDLFKKTK